jgi:methanogenic corrinoid protein MtbC1
LLTTTMPEMKRIVEELHAGSMRNRLKVMIGGAPVSAEFAQQIGADAYGRDAAEAVAIARRLIQN